MGSAWTKEENPVCGGCSICIDACPTKALEPYRMPDPSLCLSDFANMVEEQDRLVSCGLCLHLCPMAKRWCFPIINSPCSGTICCASMEVGQLALGKNATPPPGKDIIKPNQEG